MLTQFLKTHAVLLTDLQCLGQKVKTHLRYRFVYTDWFRIDLLYDIFYALDRGPRSLSKQKLVVKNSYGPYFTLISVLTGG